VNKSMLHYVFRRRVDGLHIFNIAKMWEKLMLAARIIVAIEDPTDVCLISSRAFGQRSIFKFSQYSNSQYIGGRFTPGTFTNQSIKQFLEPRVLLVSDPIIDKQAVLEASFAGIPVIALCNADTPLQFIDCAIPCNNRGRNSTAVIYWMLCREILRLRGMKRDVAWDVPVDLFIYREVEEAEKVQETGEYGEGETQDYATGARDWTAQARLPSEGGAPTTGVDSWGDVNLTPATQSAETGPTDWASEAPQAGGWGDAAPSSSVTTTEANE
jgi:small subunit ribosomal protein SAe